MQDLRDYDPKNSFDKNANKIKSKVLGQWILMPWTWRVKRSADCPTTLSYLSPSAASPAIDTTANLKWFSTYQWEYSKAKLFRIWYLGRDWSMVFWRTSLFWMLIMMVITCQVLWNQAAHCISTSRAVRRWDLRSLSRYPESIPESVVPASKQLNHWGQICFSKECEER